MDAKEYLRLSDDADDYAEAQIDKLEQDMMETIDNLLNETGGRDTALWKDMGVDPGLTVKDYEEVDPEDRDLDWSLGLSGVIAASYMQYFFDNRDETIIKPITYREKILGAADITREELIKAAKRGA